MRRVRTALACLAAALLLGCVPQPPPPEDVFYRLPPAQPEAKEPVLVDGRLGVGAITAAGPYNERAIIYVNADHPYELHRYHYHHWMNPPPRLVRDHLLDYLRAAQAAPQVLGYEPGDGAVAGLIEGRLIRFDRLVSGAAVSVSVAIEFDYGASPPAGPRWSREYRASRRAADATMEATAEAFGAALGAIYESLLQDLGRAHPAGT